MTRPWHTVLWCWLLARYWAILARCADSDAEHLRNDLRKLPAKIRSTRAAAEAYRVRAALADVRAHKLARPARRAQR